MPRKKADDLTPETYIDDDPDGTGVPENYGNPDVTRRTDPREVERTKRTIDLGSSQLERARDGDAEGKEADLAPHATHTDIPRIPTQADFWLGGQGKAQHEARRQDEEDRRERENSRRQLAPTARTKDEQKAGEALVKAHEGGERASKSEEAKAGEAAVKAREAREPGEANEKEHKAGKAAVKAHEARLSR